MSTIAASKNPNIENSIPHNGNGGCVCIHILHFISNVCSLQCSLFDFRFSPPNYSHSIFFCWFLRLIVILLFCCCFVLSFMPIIRIFYCRHHKHNHRKQYDKYMFPHFDSRRAFIFAFCCCCCCCWYYWCYSCCLLPVSFSYSLQ